VLDKIAQIKPKSDVGLKIKHANPLESYLLAVMGPKDPSQHRPAMVKQSGQRLLTDVLMTCQ
jgi:hypothetical protein